MAWYRPEYQKTKFGKLRIGYGSELNMSKDYGRQYSRLQMNFKAFYPNSNLFNKTLKDLYPMFNISVVRVPGDGSSIRFWKDNWGLGLLRICAIVIRTYTRLG